MNEVDMAYGRLGESAQRVVTRAVDESRREGAPLAGEHLLLAFAHVEWESFAEVMRGFDVNPHDVLKSIEVRLAAGSPAGAPLGEDEVPLAVQEMLKASFHRATRMGRQSIEAEDLFAAMFDYPEGGPAAIVRGHGLEPHLLVARMTAQIREREAREDVLRRRFELPPALKPFATNLNLLARQDKITPVFGRDAEIQQVLEILCHRDRSNSAMLVGEPGVGKTAIVEGVARRIELEPESVPARLRECQIANLQMNAMVAGTMLRGMFEERVQNVIREVKDHPHLILFVDEAHTLVGAGSALGAPADAANIFKSVLARGEVRMIGATTLSEYKEYIQEDEALARRFRTVQVAEPSIEEARRILYSLRPRLERSYSVRLLDEAIDTALELSSRYQRHLRLPDKVIGWLDTAAVRAEIARRWEVTAADVVAVISHAAGIPRDMVFRDVGDRFAALESRLGERVIGQRPAVEALARRLLLNKGPLKDGFDRPDGVLLFLGPTGVGKTELAKAVAELLFGDEKRMIRIDMSEYGDATSVDKLIGMPRGVSGSERGGILTNQLRDNPCSVLLLDEVEKAAPGLLNLFLSAFDEGWITDGRGKRAYLSDTIVIMTSNVGSEHFRKLTSPLGFRSGQAPAGHVESDVAREIERRFSPEFRNRIDEVVLFQPLTRDEVRAIAAGYLNEVSAAARRWGRTLSVEPEALDRIVEEGHSLEYGARFLKRVIDSRVKMPVSRLWKTGRDFRVGVRDGQVVVDATGPVLVASAGTDAIAV